MLTLKLIFLGVGGFLGGLGFNLWLKSIDYALEKNVFAKNETITLREALIEGVVDVLHHMPLWWFIAFLALEYPLFSWWVNIFLLTFAVGNIVSDIPEFIRRIKRAIKIKLRYNNLRKLLDIAKGAAEKIASTKIPIVSEIANIVASILKGTPGGFNLENMEGIQKELEKIQSELKKSMMPTQEENTQKENTQVSA